MKRLHIFLLCATVSLCKTQEVCGGECGAETLSEHDAGFCHGGLEVIYPELKISICSIVPRGQSLRDKISREWGPPRVRLTRIEKGKRYVLMMVDPDAPSRCSPTRAHWRHWLVADIAGSDLKKGDFKGSVLSEYRRPTPPRNSGLHRYQFMLFEQPADETLHLSQEESSSLGNWDPQAFIQRFGLGSPLAAVQFLTQNPKD
ncbi:phosphatidylethanolamine-binding protein 4 isoform X1 [Conger conger]|nr:phosphatidylethanolamine-binding protein 4 isoform X1 [Conger conger]XP_061115306.1 phosphatidylethanolamine-binding protein 4 isoform X1 [Conger conger]XP_061115307.1 phosphatidylethanolamine-binding protein 4 isoform X1 [Conger conger]